MSHSRQPLVKGERLVRYEVNTVMLQVWLGSKSSLLFAVMLFQQVSIHLTELGAARHREGCGHGRKPYESTWGFVVVKAL